MTDVVDREGCETHALEGVVFSVCFLQLFQDDASFVTIGSAEGEQFDALVGFESRRTFVVGHIGGGGGKGLFGNRFWNDFDKMARGLEESVDSTRSEHEAAR